MTQITQPVQIRNRSPIEALREATKWVVGPAAQALTAGGAPAESGSAFAVLQLADRGSDRRGGAGCNSTGSRIDLVHQAQPSRPNPQRSYSHRPANSNIDVNPNAPAGTANSINAPIREHYLCPGL